MFAKKKGYRQPWSTLICRRKVEQKIGHKIEHKITSLALHTNTQKSAASLSFDHTHERAVTVAQGCPAYKSLERIVTTRHS